MNKYLQQALWTVAAGLVGFVVVRRWRLRMHTNSPTTTNGDVLLPFGGDVPDDITPPDDLEIVVIDELAAIDRSVASGDDDTDDDTDAQTRKVSRDRRIKYHGQRYGPLPEPLVGQRVQVNVAHDTLHASHGGQIVASFLLHQPE